MLHLIFHPPTVCPTHPVEVTGHGQPHYHSCKTPNERRLHSNSVIRRPAGSRAAHASVIGGGVLDRTELRTITFIGRQNRTGLNGAGSRGPCYCTYTGQRGGPSEIGAAASVCVGALYICVPLSPGCTGGGCQLTGPTGRQGRSAPAGEPAAQPCQPCRCLFVLSVLCLSSALDIVLATVIDGNRTAQF